MMVKKKLYEIIIFLCEKEKNDLSLHRQKLNMILKHNISDVVSAALQGWSYYYYCLKIFRD